MTAKKNTSVLDVHNVVTPTELHELISMELNAMEADPSVVKTLPPILVHGSPGIGKSSIVRSIAEERGIDFIDVRLSTMEPCDIRGLPVPDREKNCMDWFVNGMWPRDPKGKGIIFIDELTSADRALQVAAYELVLDRRLGKLYSVPDGYLIVAAGNLTTDKAVAMAMSSALANRFTHVELRDDAEAWLAYARANDFHPSVIGFISYKNGMLFNMEGENLSRGWPSPRSWERVSQMCKIYSGSTETLLRKIVYGTVGNGAGVEFMEFYKLNAQFDNVLEYMVDPKKDVKKLISDKADRNYALCSTMNYLLWKGKDPEDQKDRIDGFYRICMELPADFATMSLTAAMMAKTPAERKSRCDMLTKNAMFPKWREKFGKSLKVNMSAI